MPRLMSFTLTTPQIRNRTKTVTRRNGWWFLKPGTILIAVEKAQGLKRGEKVKRLVTIRVISTHAEELQEITAEDVVREGFPGWTPAHFIDMFCDTHNCVRAALVNRIEFEYVEE